VLLSLTLSIV
jgi:hypothetical protein